jgi:hypothetical protein
MEEAIAIADELLMDKQLIAFKNKNGNRQRHLQPKGSLKTEMYLF